MNQNSIRAAILLFSVLGIAALLTACGRTCFVGSRTADADTYRLDIDYMTGSNFSTMELKANDTLAVSFETVRGSIYMQIKAPDKTTLYSGNGKDVTEFTVNASESGTYSIYVEAYHAKGRVHIQQKGEKKMHIDQMLAEWTAPLWAQLGMNGIAALLVLTAVYFTVKWAVKNGVKEAFREMKESEKPK